MGSLSAGIILTLQSVFPESDLLLDPADCWVYGYDNSRRHALPIAVVFPKSHEQVIELVQIANRHRLPLTPHGKGTATTGATVPLQSSIVVSFERMNRILEFNSGDRFIVVEPGITNQAVQDHVKQQGFFWAPDPSSAAFSSVGGNLACNAAGPRAVKYGTCRENTLGLRIVTGAGAALSTGVRTTKGVVGYDLTRLIIGSQGTLAFVTEATLKLLPLPETKRTLQATFTSIEAATTAIVKLMNQPCMPCALEFMDNMALNFIRDYSPSLIPTDARALLIIEVDGMESMMAEALSQLEKACQIPGLLKIQIAQNEKEAAQLWKVRKALSPLLRHIANQKINEDIVVPITALPQFITQVEQLARQHQLTIVNFGHAGNGNIHVNLLFDTNQPNQVAAAQHCLQQIFALVLSLKGTLSGEHGIGLDKLPFINEELSPAALKLMADIKHCFDPQGILNPGK